MAVHKPEIAAVAVQQTGGSGNAVLTVSVPNTPASTFFVRHGQWFILVLLVYLGLFGDQKNTPTLRPA